MIDGVRRAGARRRWRGRSARAASACDDAGTVAAAFGVLKQNKHIDDLMTTTCVRVYVCLCVLFAGCLVFYAVVVVVVVVVVVGVFDARADERRCVDAIRRERIRRHFRDARVVRVARVDGHHGEIAHG